MTLNPLSSRFLAQWLGKGNETLIAALEKTRVSEEKVYVGDYDLVVNVGPKRVGVFG